MQSASQYSATNSMRSQFKQEVVNCHRKYKNSPKSIHNFFFNLCQMAAEAQSQQESALNSSF